MSWSGRTVLITGASSGIGKAAAEAFLARGAEVIGTARSRERLEAIAGIRPIVADVADGEAMQAMANEVLATGCPDVVIANAGIGCDAAFANTPDASWQQVLDINVLGVVRTLRPFVDPMVARGSGRLLAISSIVGKRGTPYYSAYSASKFALHGMADSLRAELHGTGVSLGLVCPSSTSTPFNDNKLRSGSGQKQVRPRRHPAESVAEAIVKMAGSRRREVVLGLEAKAMRWADAIAPGLVDAMLARVLRS